MKMIPELLFGGAKFGGKSDFLLGDFGQDVEQFGPNWYGILLRQSMPEFKEIERRSYQIYGDCAEYKVGEHTWRFHNGARLHLRFLETVKDFWQYNGSSYCVGVGTPIVLGDGRVEKIENIKVGDYVRTLSGPKRVTHAVAPYVAPCCEIKKGEIKQIQPVWHSFLTALGWQSYASLLGIDSKAFEGKVQDIHRLSCENVSVVFAKPWHEKDNACHSTILSHALNKNCKQFDGYKTKAWRHISRKCLGWQQNFLTWLEKYYQNPCAALGDIIVNGQNADLLVQGFQSGCPPYSRLSDVCTPYELNNGHWHIPRLSDAVSHSREEKLLGAQDNIPTHNQSGLSSYPHPISGKELPTALESELKACSISYVGAKLVADITVDSAHHYINENGIVNHNTWIGFDEIGQWPTLEGYHMMKGCLRWAEANVPCKRIRASANPGGPGHNEVKEYFKIAEYPQGRVLIEDRATKLTRVFVPSFVQDNKIGLANDPEYILRLQTVGNEALVRAWLTGDWSVVTGAYFADRLTVYEPFELPAHWLRFRAMDWGSSKPFDIGWWAVSDGQSFKVRGWDREEKEVFLPPNCLVLYREWYGAKSANVGLKLTAREVARGIKKRSAEDYTYSVADPSVFTQDGGPSIAEEMAAEGVIWKRADRDRPAGWEQFRMRLRGFEGHPMLVVFSTCLDFIRTIPTLQHDVHKPEDLDTEGEDHCADQGRYAMMSRPWMFKKAEVKSQDPWNVGNFVEAHFNSVDRHKRL